MSTSKRTPVGDRALETWMLGGAFWGILVGALAGFITSHIPTLVAALAVSPAQMLGMSMALGLPVGALIGTLLAKSLNNRDYERAEALVEDKEARDEDADWN